MKKRCAFVVRVSDPRQGDEPGKSPDSQTEQLERYVSFLNSMAEEKGEDEYEAIDPPYELIGVSGKDSFDSPQFKKLKADILNKKVDMVMATGLDRFGRNVSKFLQFFEFLQNQVPKVDLVVTHYQIDTSTPTGQLVITILMALAEMQSHQLAKKIFQARRIKLDKGITTGGAVALGFDRDPKNPGIYKINKQEAVIVRFAFKAFLATKNLVTVANMLNAKGYRTKVAKGRGGAIKGGRKFNRRSVEYMLTNWRYCNWIEEHKKNKGVDPSQIDPEHRYRRFRPPNLKDWPPPIIPEEEFLQVQDILKGKQRSSISTNKKAKRSYLLSGLIHCGFCGKEMAADKGKTVNYYACENKKCPGRSIVHKRTPSLHRNSIRAQHLELAIKNFIKDDVLSKPNLITEITDQANVAYNKEGPQLSVEKRVQEAHLKALEDRRNGIQASIQLNQSNTQVLKDLNDQLIQVLSEIREQRRTISDTGKRIKANRASSITEQEVRLALESLASTDDLIPPHQQRELCELFISNVTVGETEIELDLNLAGIQYFRSAYGPKPASFDWTEEWYAHRDSNPKPSGP